MLPPMNMLLSMMAGHNREEIIAFFGQGRLVQLSRVRVELRGGSREDEIEARSWLAFFMPEAVLAGRGEGQPPR
jgi:hypothetical protein